MTEAVDKPLDLGIYARAEPDARPLAEVAAGVLAGVWIVAVGAYLWFGGETGAGVPSLVLSLLVVFLPLAVLWMTLVTARSVRALRDEAARLQVTVDALRSAFVLSQQAGAGGRPIERRLDEIAAAQRQTEAQLATFFTRRDSGLAVPSADRKAALVVPPRAAATEEEPRLALGTPAEDLRPPLTVADFVRALNFPDSAEDRDGFRALRLALEDRTAARLIRAAQDVLTLLSQEGIYMDDLTPDHTRPEVWRRFAAGERGGPVAALGAVRDRSSLALTAARMREDPVFRDAGHHFLRAFDKCVGSFAEHATDSELADLADTRTARAFMLFGRVAGIFD
jgi:hypothetical protein